MTEHERQLRLKALIEERAQALHRAMPRSVETIDMAIRELVKDARHPAARAEAR